MFDIVRVCEKKGKIIDPKNSLFFQTHQLITELCDFYQLPIPSELMSLLPPDVEMEKDEGHGSDMESDEIEEEQQDDEEEEGEGEAEEDDDHDLEVRELDHRRRAVQETFGSHCQHSILGKYVSE